MAENNPAGKGWSGLIWSAPIDVNKLTREFNRALDEAVAAETAAAVYYQTKARKYRRQRNGLIAILVGIAYTSYSNARRQHEYERVNPPKGM